ncbi:MAG: 16S rRNA (cytosine(967)-C(5))-methyltransferase RsmB [Acidobacteria bacterium]|nr:16S rRNA (cytosine(967)-C(5))-methyltransferase RsmB [Acidobacteriota bacterium]
MKPVANQSPANQKNKSGISPARRVAFDILRRVEAEGAYAAVLLAQPTNLSREDRALAHEITLGVLRHQLTLDFLIEKYTRRRMQKLDLAVVLALRMALYQMRFLSRIPPSAAVNEAVNLVKLARKTSAAGMVNAALRNAARNLDEEIGNAIEDPDERLAVRLSHPRWLLESWAINFGKAETEAIAVANNQTPESAFRINTLKADSGETLAKIDAAGVQTRPSKIAAEALVIASGHPAALVPLIEDGLLYPQDEASQLVAQLLDARPSQRILDLCAAPGSKTSQLAALTENLAPIVASDLHPHRLSALMNTCRRLGAINVAAVAVDATKDLPFADNAKFDRILIDAPCTGTGTLRRNPEIKWRLAPDDKHRLAEIQYTLLAGAARLLATNGRLVYSTCSLEPEENEAVVQRFLEANPQFHLVQPDAPTACLTAAGFLRTFPHRHGTDGFFAAVMER